MPIPPSGARRTGPHGFVFAHVRWIAQSRDGWSITREWRQCEHVRNPALAEADDLRLDLGLSVEQRKRAGLSRTIDYYRPFVGCAGGRQYRLTGCMVRFLVR